MLYILSGYPVILNEILHCVKFVGAGFSRPDFNRMIIGRGDRALTINVEKLIRSLYKYVLSYYSRKKTAANFGTEIVEILKKNKYYRKDDSRIEGWGIKMLPQKNPHIRNTYMGIRRLNLPPPDNRISSNITDHNYQVNNKSELFTLCLTKSRNYESLKSRLF